MNLRQMEAFRTVMQTGTVSKASQKLAKSQPAVSMLIRQLEEEIGFELFRREKKRLHPTPEAQYLFEEIEVIFDRIAEVSETVKDIRNKQIGFLRIACMPGPSICLMPDIVVEFLEDHPNIKVTMQTRTSKAVSERVASHQYDIGLAELSSTDTKNEIIPFSLDCLCALPVEHPLAHHTVITPDLLDDVAMITLGPEHMTYHGLQGAFEKAGKSMNVRLQTRFFAPALRYVERGLGVCIVDPMAAKTYQSYAAPGKVVFRRFEPEIKLKFGVMFPHDTPKSQITKKFAELMVAHIEHLKEFPDELTLDQWEQ